MSDVLDKWPKVYLGATQGMAGWTIVPEGAESQSRDEGGTFFVREACELDKEIVYFVQAEHGGPVKIGISTREGLRARLSSLQTGNPSPLKVKRLLAGNYREEAALHFAFHKARMKGEWFLPTKPLLDLLPPGTPGEVSAPYRHGYEKGNADGRETGWHDGFNAARRSIIDCLNIDLCAGCKELTSECACPTLTQDEFGESEAA